MWDELGVCGSRHHFVLVWLRGGKSWARGQLFPGSFWQSVLAVAEMETSFVDQEEGLAPLLPVLALGFLAVL